MKNELLATIGRKIRIIRVRHLFSQEELAARSKLHPTYIGGVERGERNITILSLKKILDAMGITLNSFFDDEETPATDPYQRACSFLPGLQITQYKQVNDSLCRDLSDDKIKDRDAICRAFSSAISSSPTMNVSDVWHHLIYRIFLANKKGPQPSQSWVRTSGEAFELFLQNTYNKFLAGSNIKVKALIAGNEKKAAVQALGLENKIGSSKMDIIVLKESRNPKHPFAGDDIVGVIHAKVSLAERVSDDVPASQILMKNGVNSILVTLDVKSFPQGDQINRGELGTIEAPSDKREYIEVHGAFDACFSFNSRTVPSPAKTKSGKKIFVVNSVSSKDALANYLKSL